MFHGLAWSSLHSFKFFALSAYLDTYENCQIFLLTSGLRNPATTTIYLRMYSSANLEQLIRPELGQHALRSWHRWNLFEFICIVYYFFCRIRGRRRTLQESREALTWPSDFVIVYGLLRRFRFRFTIVTRGWFHTLRRYSSQTYMGVYPSCSVLSLSLLHLFQRTT